MQKQLAVICFDMYALWIFQKLNLKHPLSFFKFSSMDNSGSCCVLRDFARLSKKTFLALPANFGENLQNFFI